MDMECITAILQYSFVFTVK